MSPAVFAGRISQLLLVEDSPIIAMDMEQMLLDLGVERVLLASTCAEALALLDSETIDVALIDLFLARGTSIPVADRLVEQHIPFALFSGYDDPKELIGRFPNVPLLNKPFRADELIALLDRLG